MGGSGNHSGTTGEYSMSAEPWGALGVISACVVLFSVALVLL